MKELSLHRRHIFRFFTLLLCGVLLIAGISFGNTAELFLPAMAKAESIDESPAEEPAPDAEPETSAPARFQDTTPLPLKTNQVINPVPATYKELKKAFEEEAAQGKNLPIICVTTKGSEYIVSRTEYIPCVIDLYNCPEKWVLDEASAGIRVRGNASSYYGDAEQIKANPVPYRIKFDTKTSMLGLNFGAKCKNWVLLKCSKRPLRFFFAFQAGRAIMGGHAFCSDCAFVHVYVNDVYQGVYTLCEQCQVNKKRVNITEPKEGYTGLDIGYYLTIDNNPEEPFAFTIDYGKHEVTDVEGETRSFYPTAYSIKSDIYTYGQKEFIENYIKSVFEILYQACENNRFLTFDENFGLVEASFTSPQETVEAVMDVESVVNMYLLYEIMHDYDVGDGSFYMCVDFAKNSKCPKLQFTSPWDFDWVCVGDTERYWAGSFSETSFVEQYGDRSNPWFVLLIKQDWFKDLACKKWTELAKYNTINSCLDEVLELITENKDEFDAYYRYGVSTAKQTADWLRKRITWMDSQFLLSDGNSAN